MNKENLRELFFSVRHDGRKLTQQEIDYLNKVALKEYDEDLFSKAIFCLSFGSNFFQKNPERIDEILKWNLVDYDLGQVFDAIKYADLTDRYIDLLFEYIDFEKFNSDWDYSSSCAMETIAYYIHHFKKEELYNRLRQYFLSFIKTLNPKELTYNQESFVRFYYSSLLYSKYGRQRHRMPFEVGDVLKPDMIYKI